MPALVKDKFLKRVAPTTNRVQAKSLNPHEVKRLGPSRRIGTKRLQNQSIQTETLLACLDHHKDVETQTINEESANPSLTTRLIQFLGGTIVSLMKKYFQMSR